MQLFKKKPWYIVSPKYVMRKRNNVLTLCFYQRRRESFNNFILKIKIKFSYCLIVQFPYTRYYHVCTRSLLHSCIKFNFQQNLKRTELYNWTLFLNIYLALIHNFIKRIARRVSCQSDTAYLSIINLFVRQYVCS